MRPSFRDTRVTRSESASPTRAATRPTQPSSVPDGPDHSPVGADVSAQSWVNASTRWAPAARASAVGQLQRQVGNAQVQRMIGDWRAAERGVRSRGSSATATVSAQRRAIQREGEEPKKDDNWVSSIASGGGEILESLGEAAKSDALGGFGQGMGIADNVTKAANGDILAGIDAAASTASVFQVPGADFISDAAGAASGVKEGIEGNAGGWAKGALKLGKGVIDLMKDDAEVAAGGEAVAAGGGAATAGVAGGEAAAAIGFGDLIPVAGAGMAGWELGKGLDKGANAIGQWITGNKGGDYSLSGLGAQAASAVDTAGTDTLRAMGVLDESKPAYTQTAGYQMANFVDEHPTLNKVLNWF